MEWFYSWFDTPYYHQLYNNRDYAEAETFMTNILNYLKLNKGASILDLACGKGRHSIFLNSKGYKVYGVDLSKQSIDHAKNNESENLTFTVHDMRDNIDKKFDAVFNLFTSFGYFEDESDDIAVLETIKNSMNDNSVAVIDFMNAKKVLDKLVESELQQRDNIKFHINRFVENNIIHKTIKFKDDNIAYEYTEKVKAIDLKLFEYYFDKVGLNIKSVFGNYSLDEYQEDTSDRLIMIITK